MHQSLPLPLSLSRPLPLALSLLMRRCMSLPPRTLLSRPPLLPLPRLPQPQPRLRPPLWRLWLPPRRLWQLTRGGCCASHRNRRCLLILPLRPYWLAPKWSLSLPLPLPLRLSRPPFWWLAAVPVRQRALADAGRRRQGRPARLTATHTTRRGSHAPDADAHPRLSRVSCTESNTSTPPRNNRRGRCAAGSPVPPPASSTQTSPPGNKTER